MGRGLGRLLVEGVRTEEAIERRVLSSKSVFNPSFQKLHFPSLPTIMPNLHVLYLSNLLLILELFDIPPSFALALVEPLPLRPNSTHILLPPRLHP